MYTCLVETPGREVGIRAARANLAAVVNEVSAHGVIVYLTSYGRRVAALVPLPLAEIAQQKARK